MITNPLQYIYPIHRPEGDGAKPFVSGSSILFQVADHKFLISAAHVFDQEDETIYFSKGNVLVLASVQVYSTPKPDNDRSKDKIDIAIMQLPEEVATSLDPSLKFLSPDDLDTNDLNGPNKKYSFTGYPATKAKPNFVLKKIKTTSVEYSLNPVPTSKFDEAGWNVGLHVVGEFDIENMAYADGKRITAPQPNGISGGPVWVKHPPYDEYKLVGIGIEWDKKHCMMVGVRIGAAITMIQHAFPAIAHLLTGSPHINIQIEK